MAACSHVLLPLGRLCSYSNCFNGAMADVYPMDDKRVLKHGDIKDEVDVESSPVYDEDGPVEFAEKADLR